MRHFVCHSDQMFVMPLTLFAVRLYPPDASDPLPFGKSGGDKSDSQSSNQKGWIFNVFLGNLLVV
jgi:hypothetical protein